MREFFIQKARELRQNAAEAEKLLWSRIRSSQLGCRFYRQRNIDDKHIVDFCCTKKKLIIEVDGGQHNGCEKDMSRDEYLRSRGFAVLRFWNNEILGNTEGCLSRIMENLK